MDEVGAGRGLDLAGAAEDVSLADKPLSSDVGADALTFGVEPNEKGDGAGAEFDEVEAPNEKGLAVGAGAGFVEADAGGAPNAKAEDEADDAAGAAPAGVEDAKEKPEKGFFACGSSVSSADLFSGVVEEAAGAAGLKLKPEKGDAAAAEAAVSAAGAEEPKLNEGAGVVDCAPPKEKPLNAGFGAVSVAGVGA